MKKHVCLCVLLIIFANYNLIAVSTYANNQEVTITKVGEFATNALYYHIEVIDDILYFTEFDTKKFCLLDVQDPSKPVSLANYSVTDGHDFEIRGDIAYLSTWEYGIEITDISNSTNPIKISNYTTGPISHLNVIDNYIYASRHTENRSYYEIIDVSNLFEPKLVKEFCEGQGAKPFIDNNLALICVKNVTSLECYFRLYNIEDRENPELVSEYISNENIYCYDIFLENDYAYFALAGKGVMIIDYSDIYNPIYVHRFETGHNVWRLHVVEDILFIANDVAGTKIIDVTSKTNPIELAKYYDGGSAYNLDMKDNLIFVADENDAIEILEIKGLEIFETSFVLLHSLLLIPILILLKKIPKSKRK